MDFEELIVDGVEKVKCFACHSLLSCSPVYLTKEKRNICGRCSGFEENYIRNKAFETLSYYVKFPCRYEKEGCLEREFPKGIPQHEQTCPFRVVKCPVGSFGLCNWEGAKSTLLNHCQDEHPDLMTKEGKFQVDTDSKETQTDLLEHDSVLFIVSRKFNQEKNVLEFSIFHIECEDDGQQLSCDVSLKANDSHLRVTTVTTNFSNRKSLPIFVDSLKSGEDSGLETFFGELSLESALPQESLLKKQVNNEMLSVLKCKTCPRYVLPPIYEEKVSDEETILRCSKCRKQSPENSKLIRNISLDKIADRLTFPCENDLQGCSFVGVPLAIEKHQQFCPEKSLTCPVDEFVSCNWKGVCNDLLAHVEEMHSEMIITPLTSISETVPQLFSIGKTISKKKKPPSSSTQRMFIRATRRLNTNQLLFGNEGPKLTSTSSNPTTSPISQPTIKLDFNSFKSQGQIKSYIIIFSKTVFRVNYAVRGDSFFWCAQPVGRPEEDFMYEVEIFHPSNKHTCFIIQLPCIRLIKMDEVFSGANCHLHKSQLERFMLDQQIMFKVRIYK